MSTLRFVTWNVHGCVGIDGLVRPERVAAQIARIDPDVIGLQEMLEPALPQVATLTGLRAVAGVTRPEGESQFGNALLTRHQVDTTIRHDVSYGTREPRGVLGVRLRQADGQALRVLVTHFGLLGVQRRRQADLLLELVHAPGAELLAVLGDFNEWRPFSRTLQRLDAHLGLATNVRSFPSPFPFLRLDRIWVWPREALVGAGAWRGPGAWRTSDHLPVVATVDRSRLSPHVPPPP